MSYRVRGQPRVSLQTHTIANANHRSQTTNYPTTSRRRRYQRPRTTSTSATLLNFCESATVRNIAPIQLDQIPFPMIPVSTLASTTWLYSNQMRSPSLSPAPKIYVMLTIMSQNASISTVTWDERQVRP